MFHCMQLNFVYIDVFLKPFARFQQIMTCQKLFSANQGFHNTLYHSILLFFKKIHTGKNTLNVI